MSKHTLQCVVSDTECRIPRLKDSFSCIGDVLDHDFDAGKFEECGETWRVCRKVSMYMGNMGVLAACDQMALGCFKTSIGL